MNTALTGKERLLQLLSDGKPHSHHETYALGIMAHSRAADLRKPKNGGHDVRVWREGNTYWYQLVVAPTAGGPQEVSPAVGGAPSSSPSSPGASPQEATAPLPQAGPEPLTLFGDERSHYSKEEAA